MFPLRTRELPSACMILVSLATCVILLGAALAMTVSKSLPISWHQRYLHPVIFFPGYGESTLRVIVHNQSIDPHCPRNGEFLYRDNYTQDSPLIFSQVCKNKFLTLRYASTPTLPMNQRFSNQIGIITQLYDYGLVSSAPDYDEFYHQLESAGLIANYSLRIADYDSRLTPDIGDFLYRTQKLVEDTYYRNHQQAVELVGHSNGPLYAWYLLTHTSQAWKDKYILGFTVIAGNFGGSGSSYGDFFMGYDIENGIFPPTLAETQTSVRMYLTQPADYMSSSDPHIFGNKETIFRIPGQRSYTPQDYPQLMKDAHLTKYLDIARYYIGFIKFYESQNFPNVNTVVEIGTDLSTTVGYVMPNIQSGQINHNNPEISLSGDSNQEYITNDSYSIWSHMRGHSFRKYINHGVRHEDLCSNPHIVARLVNTIAE